MKDMNEFSERIEKGAKIYTRDVDGNGEWIQLGVTDEGFSISYTIDEMLEIWEEDDD